MNSLTESPRNDQGNLAANALHYASRGWSLIPVKGKKAGVRWEKFQNRPADERTLRRFFARDGIDGLAVITGRISGGLAVRDFDIEEAYLAWADANPDDASRLPTVSTARGYHVYGTLAQEKFSRLCDGELRADSGHYVVMPPSRHPIGDLYRWKIPLPPVGTPLPLLPVSLIQAQTQFTQVNSPNSHHPLHGSQPGQIESLISRTLPSGPGQRNRRVFDLARGLLGILGRNVDAKELRRIVKDWHRQALPHIRTKPFDETWTDYVTAWERIKQPAGASLIAAINSADTMPVPDVAKQYDTPALRRLVSICTGLAAQWGDNPFPLGCAKAGEIIGVSKTEAHRLLRTLQFDGIIVRTLKGTKASGKASEWRFIDTPNANCLSP